MPLQETASRFTRWNCGRCGYLAMSSPHEDTDKGTEIHKCPECGEQWWLDEDTYARRNARDV